MMTRRIYHDQAGTRRRTIAGLMRRALTHATVLAVAALAALTACQPRVPERVSAVAEVDVPEGLFLSAQDGAKAFRVAGEDGTTIPDVSLPAGSPKEAGEADYMLYAFSNGRHRVINHRRKGDRVIADLVAGKTYVLVPRYTGHLAESLGTFCRLVGFARARAQRLDIPRICTQILCAPELMSGRDLLTEHGLPEELLVASTQLGGWQVIPGDLCDSCTNLQPGTIDLGIPTLSCLAPAGSECDDGELLFNDDFEADVVGNAPLAAPAGPPPGDSVVISGDVEIVNAASQAARVARSATAQVNMLDAVFGGGATNDGAYCIRFTGRAAGAGSSMAPVGITLRSQNGAVGLRIVVDEDSATVTTGAAQHVDNRDYSVARDFRIDLDLDLGVFDLFVDGSSILTGQPLMDPAFDVPERLRFAIGTCILECFDSAWTVDDISVRKVD